MIFNKLFKKEKPMSSHISFNSEEDLYEKAKILVVEAQNVSASFLQRRFAIGYQRSCGIIDRLENDGIISASRGSNPREVYIHSLAELELLNEKRKQRERIYNSIDNQNIENMSGMEFESFSARLLEKNGFSNVEITQFSGDFGVDIIAYKDEVKYAIQCKKYSTPVGIKAVQEVIGSKTMNNCHVAVVLTNSTFTKSAIELAKANNVLLWDKVKLHELMNNL